MVSTRRSAGAGTQSNTEQDAEAGHQTEVVSTEVVSKLRSSRVSVAGSSGHAPALQPIEEEQPAAPPPAAARHTRSHAEDASDEAAQQEQLQQQQHALGQRQQQQRRQQRPLPSPAPAGGRAAGGSAAAAAAAAAGAGCESEDDDDWDFDGPDMLRNLAATIRSALGSKPSRQQHAHCTAGDGPAGDDDDDDDDDVKHLRWRPHTGLQLPHKAAQVVAAAAATTASKQQPDLGGGPVVHNPVLQEQEQEEDANAAAAAAAVSKPKGLAKHSRAPTQDAAAAAKAARKAAPETAGKNWYGLPAVKIDDNMKRDLRLLRLRGAYDPKRFYKSFDETKFPKHFAIGTVVDDPLDYYGGRLTTGQRKASLTEQLLADGELQATRKKRFNKLQEEAQKWVKHKKRKTSQPRKTPSKHRPKH